ncbi:Na+/H+ antiporter subunit E (plasmid) [Rhizobium oryzihabitans]|uniref:Na+/H+ antiporter subunit E n=1 Tax=Rhizobium oryzihabitans TaxID=2267833 RepID=A0A7L5BR37_9HYPH|nr:Na+/H+ antiporter subunit E [Rhizobium oryzihabitans]QCM08810.1 Na+/H+ antiporter subunit E [Agrobacterium tumefaciens]QIB41399.1 Na+/H+ antiporter subunit E [Rhizobium oryzihabitans]CUX67612.1 Na(+) H(+) antiporter subunit E [Agrobacterium genomosp. 5 str. CFBP 6626]
MKTILPHPVLSLVIAVIWVMLINEISTGTIVFGLAMGLAIPLTTARFWPGNPVLKAPLAIAEFLLVVLWDIVISNIHVARLVLTRKGASLRSTYVTVPLDLKTPEAITALAGTITMTPGTVSADLSADGKAILVHCLETDDPAGVVVDIKQRYERRLKRIFE